MMKPEDIELESRLLGVEPKGCVQCREGAKLVLLVTGICGYDCYYCPLSEKKMGRDVVFANELKVWEKAGGVGEKNEAVKKPGYDKCNADNGKADDADDDTQGLLQNEPLTAQTNLEIMDQRIIEESRSISAAGTGITGGDPMVVFRRTLHFIRLLKTTFGREHHIHLYTATIPTHDQLMALKEVGLDEIRFHLVDVLEMYSPGDQLTGGCELETFLEGYLDAIKTSKEIGLDAGVEIPVIADQLDLLFWLARKLEASGTRFLNLNELEFSPTNAAELVRRGFVIRDEISSAALGSRETAYEFMDRIASEELGMAIHFCSSRYKDAGQLRRRLRRRAGNVAKPHELLTEDDTLLIGIIEPGWDLEECASELRKEYEIPEEMIHVNDEKKRVEVAPWILQEIAEELKAPACLIEEYPSADRLEVEREKLNERRVSYHMNVIRS